MLGVIRALTQLLHVWWTKDRIRVACGEGKLFRIRVGNRLLIEDKIFQVIARNECESTEEPHIVYKLAEEHGDTSELWSLKCTMHNELASLSQHADRREILGDHVVVLQSKFIQ
jgi:hypothetical protein